MENWVITRKGGDFGAIGEKFHISPRLACLIRNRDVVGDEEIENYLNGSLTDLQDAMLMKGMNQAVDILKEKIQEGKSMRVIGDYDIDGINATYILVNGLEHLGGKVDYDIPDRITDGYGLNEELIKRAYRDGVDTIITCDNGIAASDEIAYGKDLGMTMIVTDHHEVPFTEIEGEKEYHLPEADAVVDPKQPGCEYPYKELCGAAIAYKVIEVLCDAMGRDSEDFDYLIENVAVATVGDVVDLTGENRIFVKEGLEMLSRTHNLGMQALIKAQNLSDAKKISAYHIGFVLGPCMNASGRLDTAKRSLELLTADNALDAQMLAKELVALNDSRKSMTNQAVDAAVEMVEQTDLKEDKVLVIYLPECHESIAGIVAGRIRETFYKPTLVVTKASEGLKGSGRSIEAYHMYEEINKCKDLLTKFGGHKMAAGFSLKEDRLEEFRRKLNEQCTLSEKDLMEKVVIDMVLPFSCVTEEFVEELERLEPFGKANRKPVFALRQVRILEGRILGKNQNVLKLKLLDAEGTMIDGMRFGDIQGFLEAIDEKHGIGSAQELLSGRMREKTITMDITYYPEINTFRGIVTPQVIITHYR